MTMPQNCCATSEEKKDNIFSLTDPRVNETILELRALLERQCGAKSKFSILCDPFQPMEEVIFTKDGYNTIKNVIYTDPVKKMTHRLICYIGERVSKIVGDGTTTAMLLAMNVILRFIKDDNIRQLIHSKSYSQMRVIFQKLIELYESRLDSSKFTVESLLASSGMEEASYKDVVKAIAYHQAMTSSHGDEEVAIAVSEMFMRLPIETMDNIIFMRAGFETPWRIKLMVDEHQYSCQSDILATTMLNQDLKSWFKSDNCLVDVLNNHITRESQYYIQVHERIMNAYETQSNYVCICTSACPQTRIAYTKLLADLASKYEVQPDVGIFFIPMNDTFANDAFIMSLVAGIQYPSATDINTLPNWMTVTFKKGTLTLSGFYEGTSELHEALRPWYQDARYPQFNAMLRQLEVNIEQCKSADNESTHISHQIREYTRLKNLLLLDKRCYVMIGGSIHDNTALFDIVEDCVHAVRKSLTLGFVPGGCVSALDAFKMIANIPAELISESNIITGLAEWYCEAITDITGIFLPATVALQPPSRYCSYDVLTETMEYLEDPSVWLNPMKHHAIIQPANTDITIIKRIEEVLLKFFFSTDFIYTRRI